MLLFILLTVKFLLFQYFTKIISAPWLVFAMDMVFLSIYYLIARRKDKVSTIISLVIYSVISFIIFADIVYFTYFNRLPSIYELGHAGVLTDVTDAIFVLIRWHDYLFILDIPVLIFLAYKNKLHLIDQFIEDKLKKFYQYIPYAMLLISVLIIAIGHNRINEVRDMQLFTYHARDILGLRHENYSDLDLQGNYEKSSNTPNEWTGIAKGKNLFIIQVESLNNFVINREYNGHEITPVMNKLIEENGTIYADDYFELLGAGNTSDAEFVSLHSLYPSIKNPSYEVYKDKYVFGLPKILTENGYKNTAFHNYKRDFWIRDTAYPHIGFERFIAEDNYELDDIIAMGLSDKSFFRQSMPYILDMDRPIFAFLVTLTSHIPYEMPDEDIVIPIKPKDQGSIFGNYMNSIHYTDAAIGEFIDDLKKHNLYDDSVIVIYGDHHALNGSDIAESERITELTGKKFDFDTMLNIPLIIHIGGSEEKALVKKTCSQLDLAPTLLNLYDIDKSPYIMFGHDIMDENHPGVVFPQTYMLKGSYIDGEYMFIMGRDGIFENGTLKKRENGEIVDNQIARYNHEKALHDINLCTQILEQDRIEALMNDDDTNIIADEELKDAVIVKNENELKLAYEAGFDVFKVRLTPTSDGFYVSDEKANEKTFDMVDSDMITLGEIVGGDYPKGLKFILDTQDVVTLVETINNLPGLYPNLIIETPTKPIYEKISHNQRGYKLLLHGNDFSKEELKSIAQINQELYFYNIDIPNLDSRTYHPNKGNNQILALDDIELKSIRKFEKTEISPYLVLLKTDDNPSYDDLKDINCDEPIIINFELDPENENLAIAKLEGDKILSSENLDELLEENKNLKIAVNAPEFTIEILRNLLKTHPDLDRIIPIVNNTTQVPFAKRMGYENYVLNLDSDDIIVNELRKIWRAKLPSVEEISSIENWRKKN